MHDEVDRQRKAENLSMHGNGLRRHRFNSRKSSRVRGEVLVLPSNYVPGVGFVREDFILVVTLCNCCWRSAKIGPWYCQCCYSLRCPWTPRMWIIKAMIRSGIPAVSHRIFGVCLGVWQFKALCVKSIHFRFRSGFNTRSMRKCSSRSLRSVLEMFCVSCTIVTLLSRCCSQVPGVKISLRVCSSSFCFVAQTRHARLGSFVYRRIEIASTDLTGRFWIIYLWHSASQFEI